MTLAALLALALFAQDAAAAQTPALAAAPVAPAAATEGPVPPGAPEDDYGLVAWCHGALAGHMALYAQVKPTLDENESKSPGGGLSPGMTTAEMDAQQMAAGREYLALYERATKAAETANPRIRTRGEQARAKGASMWTPVANAVDPKDRMWSWLGWSLPGRCETAAKRLEERAALLARRPRPSNLSQSYGSGPERLEPHNALLTCHPGRPKADPGPSLRVGVAGREDWVPALRCAPAGMTAGGKKGDERSLIQHAPRRSERTQPLAEIVQSSIRRTESARTLLLSRRTGRALGQRPSGGGNGRAGQGEGGYLAGPGLLAGGGPPARGVVAAKR
jgi:hypothetical protein